MGRGVSIHRGQHSALACNTATALGSCAMSLLPLSMPLSDKVVSTAMTTLQTSQPLFNYSYGFNAQAH